MPAQRSVNCPVLSRPHATLPRVTGVLPKLMPQKELRELPIHEEALPYVPLLRPAMVWVGAAGMTSLAKAVAPARREKLVAMMGPPIWTSVRPVVVAAEGTMRRPAWWTSALMVLGPVRRTEEGMVRVRGSALPVSEVAVVEAEMVEAGMPGRPISVPLT